MTPAGTAKTRETSDCGLLNGLISGVHDNCKCSATQWSWYMTWGNRVSLKKRADVRITPARAEPRKSGPDFAIAGATDVDGLGVRLPRRDAFYQPARGIRRHAEIVVVAVLIGAKSDLRRTGAWAPTSRRRADAVARKASRRTPRQYCSKGTADSGDLHHLTLGRSARSAR